MCTVSGSSICYFHRCLCGLPSPPPHPWLSDLMSWKPPQTSRVVSFPPAACCSRASSLSPKLSFFCGPGRTPWPSTAVLESPTFLLFILFLEALEEGGDKECRVLFRTEPRLCLGGTEKRWRAAPGIRASPRGLPHFLLLSANPGAILP